MHTKSPLKIGVLGGGAWGTALAATAVHAGHDVLIWDRDPMVTDDITKRRQNSKRFPHITLPQGLKATGNLAKWATFSDIMVIAIPSEANAMLASQLAAHTRAEQIVVLAAKGFRETDGALLSTVWRESIPHLTRQVVLTGPTFARELVEQQPTAFLLAGQFPEAVEIVTRAFTTPWVRAYAGSDIIGAQVGGALKNVLAVGAGVLDGLGLGHNARAAMLTRGLNEMARFAKALGGQERTIYGLSGMGDVMLTATSQLSRNYRFGQLVGRGTPVAEAKLRIGTVEGLLAARIATVQAQSLGLDMALISATDGILHGDVTPLQAVEYLMSRPTQSEF
jgi:glycerol-3-phosphate dehydrogenase (NAD(P)+)